MIRFTFRDSSITTKLLGFIKDTYRVGSIKNMTRQKRLASFKFNITVFEQNMPRGNTWQELLNRSKYKDQFIEMIKQYVLQFSTGILPRPFIMTSRKKENFILFARNQVISPCNHEEADTRLVLHASKENSDVVAVCKYTDVLILNNWAYLK